MYACYFDGILAPTSASTALSQSTDITVPSLVGTWSGFDRNWGNGLVAGSGKSDSVSGVWRGNINFQQGLYVFHTLSDDGIELKVADNAGNLQTVINNWTNHAPTQDNSASIFLSAGYHNVQMRWFENAGGAQAKLWWDFTLIPDPTNLALTCPAPGTTVNASWTNASGWSAYYLRADTNPNAVWPNFSIKVPENGSSGVGSSYSFSSIAGQTYYVWIHTRDATTGGWSNAITGSVNCTSSVTTPNLTVTVASPSVATVGTSATFSSIVSNIGTASTGAGTFNNIFQFDDDANHNDLPFLPKLVTAGPLAVNGTANISSSHTFSSPGTWYVRSCADLNQSSVGSVTESNENDNCGSTWTTVTVDCPAGTMVSGMACVNILPVANAGRDKAIVLPVSSSAPKGASATDTTPGTISSTVWTQVGSTPSVATITDGTTLSPTFSNLSTAGTYTFRLTVTDNDGGTNTDDMLVVVTLVPMGTITPASSTCDIVSGASSCNKTLVWDTQYPTGTSTISSNAAIPSPITINSGSQSFYIPYNPSGAVFTLTHPGVQNPLATSTVIARCIAGTIWNEVSCVPSTMSGTLTSVADTCTITAGNQNCLINFSWTTTNPMGVSKVTSDINDIGNSYPNFEVATGNNGGPVAFTIPYTGTDPDSGRKFYLYNNTFVLAEKTVKALPDSNCTMVNGTCVLIGGEMSGTLSPASPSCIIAQGSSTCAINFSWTTTNPVGVSAITSDSLAPNTVIATGNTGSSAPFNVFYAQRNFYLYNNGIELAQSTVSAVCISGTVFVNGKCDIISDALAVDLKVNGVDADTSETAKRALLGQTLNFSWSATGDNGTLSCVLEDGTAGWAGPASPTTSGVKNIISPTTQGLNKYSIRCTDNSGTVVDSAWVKVDVISTDIDTSPTVIYAGSTIKILWQCPSVSTFSVGVNFDTGGLTSGNKTLVPDTTKVYSVICNDPSIGGNSVRGDIEVTVKKKAFYIEN
jgi:hypothetical protein